MDWLRLSIVNIVLGALVCGTAIHLVRSRFKDWTNTIQPCLILSAVVLAAQIPWGSLRMVFSLLNRL